MVVITHSMMSLFIGTLEFGANVIIVNDCKSTVNSLTGDLRCGVTLLQHWDFLNKEKKTPIIQEPGRN